jgi:hypothetical protein
MVSKMFVPHWKKMVTAWCPHTQNGALFPIGNTEEVIQLLWQGAGMHCHAKPKYTVCFVASHLEQNAFMIPKHHSHHFASHSLFLAVF